MISQSILGYLEVFFLPLILKKQTNKQISSTRKKLTRNQGRGAGAQGGQENVETLDCFPLLFSLWTHVEENEDIEKHVLTSLVRHLVFKISRKQLTFKQLTKKNSPLFPCK